MDNGERKPSASEEERKQASRRLPFAVLNEVHSDFAIAMALQEQERAFNSFLPGFESGSGEEEEVEESEEDSSEENNEYNEYEFFESQEIEAADQLDFHPEGQDSVSEDDDYMDEEDEIDPDELSYEELIALGEFIGEERKGLSISEVSSCLRPWKFQPEDRKTGVERCVICQVEYEEGEELAALPCEHPYHSECITQWLQIKKICPICSNEVSPPKISRNV